jgi:hypothetical protein
MDGPDPVGQVEVGASVEAGAVEQQHDPLSRPGTDRGREGLEQAGEQRRRSVDRAR